MKTYKVQKELKTTYWVEIEVEAESMLEALQKTEEAFDDGEYDREYDGETTFTGMIWVEDEETDEQFNGTEKGLIETEKKRIELENKAKELQLPIEWVKSMYEEPEKQICGRCKEEVIDMECGGCQ